jgi:hypothetical protein
VPLNLVSIPGGPVISAIGDYDGFRHTDVTQYSPIHTPTMGTTWASTLRPESERGGACRQRHVPVARHGHQLEENRQHERHQGQLALSADGKVIVHCPEK